MMHYAVVEQNEQKMDADTARSAVGPKNAKKLKQAAKVQLQPITHKGSKDSKHKDKDKEETEEQTAADSEKKDKESEKKKDKESKKKVKTRCDAKTFNKLYLTGADEHRTEWLLFDQAQGMKCKVRSSFLDGP